MGKKERERGQKVQFLSPPFFFGETKARALVSRSGMERDFVPLVPRKREEEKPLKEEE